MDLPHLFAERIGGARFGTGGEIYKFERIKPPTSNCSTSVWASRIKWPRKPSGRR